MGDGYGLELLARCEASAVLLCSMRGHASAVLRCSMRVEVILRSWVVGVVHRVFLSRSGGGAGCGVKRGMRRDHIFKQRESPLYEILPDTKKPLHRRGQILSSKLIALLFLEGIWFAE